MTAGYFKLDIPLWRPTGAVEDEMNAYFLGNSPSLVSPEPIYDSAWRERSRFITTSAGIVTIELFVVCRNTSHHGLDESTKP
jgi:hypothetical protein